MTDGPDDHCDDDAAASQLRLNLGPVNLPAFPPAEENRKCFLTYGKPEKMHQRSVDP
jgi:hypothetical protein